MKSSAILAAVLLVATAACTDETSVAAVGTGANSVTEEPAGTAAAGDDEDVDYEADGDHKHASFSIVIEHTDGWRCGGSLVSLRVALTSAWCARGRGRAPPADLWALAAAAAAAGAAPAARRHGARRIVRVAVAADADAEVSDVSRREEGSWRGGAMDLAVVELEEPFGSAAMTVAILMATEEEECRPPGECHVVRAGPRRTPLRFAAAALRRPAACLAAAPHWPAIRDRALCLVGSKLCENDWGAGVVCGGKLCGVLSRSVPGAGAGSGVRAGVGAGVDVSAGVGSRGCGHTHAAQSVVRWRRFLHCAHTLRACASDGECAKLCVERRLLEEKSPPPPSPPPPQPAPPTRAPSRSTPKARRCKRCSQ